MNKHKSKFKKQKNSLSVTNYDLFQMLKRPGVLEIEIPNHRIMNFVRYAIKNIDINTEIKTDSSRIKGSCFISLKKK